MSDDDLQSRIEQAETNWQSVAQGNPGDNTWGFFSYGDAPGGIGGGVGMFIWFPDRNEMLDFIATTLPYYPPGRGDLDWGSVASQSAAIVEEMKSADIDDAVGVERLNEVLRTFSQIEWTGTFEELLRGGHSYATEVRAAFRNEDEEGSSGAPIQPDEQEAFCEYLETWGI
jgi:hypothetical protein